jgi:D-3-phosphoglycerate dehydrogenase
MVNAPVLARQRDIAVSEVKHERDSDYQTLMRLTVTTEKRSRGVAGTLFGGTRPRLVAIEDIAIEAELGPHMLFVRNRDKPGFIGALGTTLGSAGVNIATFHLGRSAPGVDALCLVEVDEPLGDFVLDQVCALPNVVQVKALRF